jgi:hypothetical protein
MHSRKDSGVHLSMMPLVERTKQLRATHLNEIGALGTLSRTVNPNHSAHYDSLLNAVDLYRLLYGADYVKRHIRQLHDPVGIGQPEVNRVQPVRQPVR